MASAPTTPASPTDKSAPLAHIVYFSLAEPSEANRAKLIASCKRYLTDHDGLEYFAVGVNAPEYDREVNDRDYDVALHLVFRSARDQDAYQSAPRHQAFIEECRPLWKRVRVFDSTLR